MNCVLERQIWVAGYTHLELTTLGNELFAAYHTDCLAWRVIRSVYLSDGQMCSTLGIWTTLEGMGSLVLIYRILDLFLA